MTARCVAVTAGLMISDVEVPTAKEFLDLRRIGTLYPRCREGPHFSSKPPENHDLHHDITTN
jgi:hypothetical protein